MVDDMVKEIAEKISKIISEETKAKMRAVWTPERRAEWSAARIGKNNPMYGKIPSEEHKAKISEAWTPERRVEKSMSMTGENNPMKRPEVKAKHKEAVNRPESKAKASEAKIEYWKDPKHKNNIIGENNPMYGRVGEKSPNWQGGISFELYGIDFNDELKEQIRKRDNYICQICDKTQKELGRKLDIHHIDYDKINNKPENLISLCRTCHGKTNFNREDWTEYFRKMIDGETEKEKD